MTVGLSWYGMRWRLIHPKRTTMMIPTIMVTGFSMENLMVSMRDTRFYRLFSIRLGELAIS
jgi:hypothetical protein